MNGPKSVVVCGGGIIGLTCAYFLAREGCQVTLVERNAEGGDSCALGSAGYISPSHLIPLAAPGMMTMALKRMRDPRSPFYMKPRLDPEFLRWGWLFWRAANASRVARAAPLMRDLCLGSRAWFEDFAATTGNAFAFEKRGLYNICRTEHGLAHEIEVAKLIQEHGVEAKVFDAAETARRHPGLNLSTIGSVFFPVDCHLVPRRLVDALVAGLKQMKVDLRWNTEVTGWRTASGKIAAAQTATGEITGDEFVLAGGSWSPGMLQSLGLRMPIQAGKGYSLTMENPRQMPSAPMTCLEARIAITPMGGALRFGGTMELSGMNDTLRPERVRQIIETVPHYLPDFREIDFTGIKPWFGRRPVSPDGVPYIGRFKSQSNLIAACGHAMLGVTMAPATALIVAELVAGRKPSYPMALLNPDRYG